MPWMALWMTTLAGLSTGLGGLLAVLLPPTEKVLAAGAGLAGGVMLTISFADLVPEAVSLYTEVYAPWVAGAGVVLQLALGTAAAFLLSRALPEESALAARFGNGAAGSAMLRAGLVTGVALLLHNLPEGMLTLLAGVTDPRLGLRTALAVALHNLPEGMAVAMPFACATRSRGKGVLAALVSGLAEPLGAVLALPLLSRGGHAAALHGVMLGAAGIMLGVTAGQLLPQAFAPRTGKAGAIGFIFGCFLMLFGVAAME